jgi:hypothetical protein
MTEQFSDVHLSAKRLAIAKRLIRALPKENVFTDSLQIATLATELAATNTQGLDFDM